MIVPMSVVPTVVVPFVRQPVVVSYHIPVIVRDSGNPAVSGTNTLTVVIGDVNDNPHRPAHKHVLAYLYQPGIYARHLSQLTWLFICVRSSGRITTVEQWRI